jgi:phosphatidylserine decarboxylase
MSEPAPGAGGRAFVALQHLLPQHGISRLVLAATRSRSPAFKNALIRLFVRGFKPDMADAVEIEPTAYASFNEFFTRALREGTRPVDADPRAIVSPVDGTVSEAGTLNADRLLQAKGHEYTLRALLAGNGAWERTFAGGSFATIYLAPYNYHRIHMPLDGELRESFYVPGRLFSVNRTTAQLVPGLFSRNERVFCGFDAGGTPFGVILVGALNVGSMATVWHGDVTPRKHREVTALPVTEVLAAKALPKGAEMARFNMGSTVILLLPPGAAEWTGTMRPGQTLRMGERIGTLRDWHPGSGPGGG